MGKKDQWSGIFLLIVSAAICWASTDLPYGKANDPGPGFLPLWLGIVLGGMSIGLILQGFREKGKANMIRDLLLEDVRWGKVFAALMALIVYAFAMEYLGFLIVTILLIAFLMRFIDPQPWKTVILWTLTGSIGSYLIFQVWLKLRLPKGLLGV
jgi:putative tricarboxylic transport membrane protein